MLSNVKRALVVGGTGGIGYAIACRIATEAAASTVIISGRNKPSSCPHPNIEFRPLDASSMGAINAYTTAHKAAQEPKLDLLVMTQGILTLAGRTETPEGIDRKMALHYYGRQLLIRELLPALQDDARVLIVLDSVKGSPVSLNWEDLDLKTTYSIGNALKHTLSMTDAMVQQFAAQQKGGATRQFIHAYPGFVKTNLERGLPWLIQIPTRAVVSLFSVSAATCAENLLNGAYQSAAADREEDRFWSYIDPKGSLVPNKAVWTEKQRQNVEEHTWRIADDAINAGGSA